MANNVSITVKKAGYANGSAEAAELPADLVAALADNEQSEVLVEVTASGKTYTLLQVA